MGILYSDFVRSTYLKSRFDVLATIHKETEKEDEFVAIMEAIEYPLYVMTYNLEMTQNQHVKGALVNRDPIDRKGPSRKHAQFIANTIADEAKINKHEVAVDSKAKSKLKPIWFYKVSSIQYSSEQGESSMPKGLEF